MKVTIRRGADGGYSAYVAKKDLEAAVVSMEKPTLWGGKVVLDNGWRLELPPLDAETRLPITVEARRLDG